MFGKIGPMGKSFASASLLVYAAAAEKKENLSAQPNLVRPSDLPLYDEKPTKCSSCHNHPKKEAAGVRKTLEESVTFARSNICQGYNIVASEAKQINHFYETGKEHSKFVVDYLNEPSNSLPRGGAIAVGGLSGYIFALRHGFFRRVLYTSIGAGALASLCYPKEAELYAQQSLAEAKTWVTIAYNFAYGVKPGDEAKAIELPASVTTFIDSANDAYESVKVFFSTKK